MHGQDGATHAARPRSAAGPAYRDGMRVAVYSSPGRIAFREVPTPRPAPDEVLVRIRAIGICGSDLHRIYHDTAVPGVVLGHEWVATVEALGTAVPSLRIGDRVIPGAGPGVAPGPVPPSPNDPPAAAVAGVSGARARHSPRDNGSNCFPATNAQGGFAELTLRKWWSLGVVPADLDDFAAAACEPLAVAVHAVCQSPCHLGSTVAVIGLGPIGLFVVQAARLQGATRIIAVDPDPHRREIARATGADVVIDPTEGDALDAVVAAAGGSGPAITFECAGAPDTLQLALESVGFGGAVLLVAVRWVPTPITPVEWLGRQPHLIVSYGYGNEGWPTALRLLADGRATIRGLVDPRHVWPLSRLQEALDRCVARDSGVIKAMIVPDTTMSLPLTPRT
jgi:L-iditol 2-dehydrogenase